MIDIIKTTIFPPNIISGVATGYMLEYKNESYFETPFYNQLSVEVCRKNLELKFKTKINSFYYQKQIHSDIVLVDSNTEKHTLVESDAIISNISGVLYNVSIADCQAVLVYDPVRIVIAAIHSGWKGSSLNIVGKTIDNMKDSYGTNPKDLLVYLAPSACVNNYEVGDEFTDLFPRTTIRIEDKYYFDNRKEIIEQLLESGIIKTNIESNDECTITNKRFHSYRRDKSESGRMSAFIGIKAHI